MTSYDEAEKAGLQRDWEAEQASAGDSEFFDDTGTPSGFCPECEHAPCVAGGKRFCTMRPRFIVAQVVGREVLALVDQHYRDPLYRTLRSAVSAISHPACRGGRGGSGAEWMAEDISAGALEDLAGLRTMLRGLS